MIHPGTSRRKKTEEVQNLSSASEETASDHLERGGDDEVDKEETNGKEDQQKQGEVTPPRDPVDEADPSKKRKVSPMKPTSRKKSKASTLTKMQTVLTLDDFDFIIAAVSDASQDILQKHEAKQEEMYDRIEVELRGVQQALQSSRSSIHCAPTIRRTRVGR
jgi:flagellar hook-basal body complex protein FliE